MPKSKSASKEAPKESRRVATAPTYDEIALRALQNWTRDSDPTLAVTLAEIQRHNRQEALPESLQ